jgi:hypothetical protein
MKPSLKRSHAVCLQVGGMLGKYFRGACSTKARLVYSEIGRVTDPEYTSPAPSRLIDKSLSSIRAEKRRRPNL